MSFSPLHINLKFKMATLTILLSVGVILTSQKAKAQPLSLTFGVDATTLAETITGSGVQILNPVLTCPDSAYGTYDVAAIPDFPHGPGVILSTGNIKDANGPNLSQTITTVWDEPGDPLMTTLSGHQSYDACRLEFDVVPVGDTLRFNFTFASEEYNEYVGTPFNDAFGFFISGPGITGDPGFGTDQNIALVPGTGMPVTINSVNNGNPDIGYPPINPQYFHNNPLGFSNTLQYDGWTIDLYAEKVVSPCDTFHLKLVIADIADYKWDSSVFIEKIASNNISLSSSTIAGIDEMVEGCNNGEVTFTREPVTDQPLIVTYFIDGTATNGTDYNQIGSDPNPLTPNFITIPANQGSIDIDITTIADGLVEGSETINFYVGNPYCEGTIQDSLTFIIQDSLDLAIIPPLSFVCLGDSLPLHVASSGTSFEWSPADFLNDPLIKDPTTTPLSDIIYTLTATAAGCTSTATAEIHVTDVELTVNATQILCAATNSGAIDLSISGGQSPLEIQWVGPNGFISSNEDLTGLAPGTYAVLVTDRDGCTGSISVDITELPAIDISLSSPVFNGGDNISCFQGSNGQATAAISGGTAPYTFQWNDPSNQNTQTAIGLSAGTYILTVTDANLCTVTDTITLTQPDLITGALISRTNVLCFGENVGEATVEATGGHAPYTYLWNTVPPQSGTSATNLGAGFYTVTITDSNGCTGNTEVEIEQPDSPLSGIVNSTNLFCNGDSSGTAEAVITGGVLPYQYIWSDDINLNIATRSNLAAGNYTLTVIDDNGCTFVIPFVISEPPAINISLLSQNNISCAGDNSGSITVNASGGTGGLSYTWNTNPVLTGNSISGLGAGVYVVSVSDANGCADSLEVTLTEPDTLNLTLVSQVSPSCANSTDGSIEIAAAGGVPPYHYVWNTVPLTSGATLSGIGAGTYGVTVTDSNGCSALMTIELNAPDPLTISLDSIQHVLCNGGSTGQVSISVMGGTPGYTYLWDDPLNQTTATVNNLSAGTYTALVTDANGCTAQFTVTIHEPQFPLTATLTASQNISCYGDSTGSATVQASGGSGSYSYSWNDPSNQTTPMATNLPAGSYQVTISDNNGCAIPVILNVVITQPSDPLTITLTPSSYPGGVNVVCADDSTATIDLAISGGTGPYTILWNLPGIDTSADEDLSNLAPGTYSVTVTDANGCTTSESITLVAPSPIEISYTTTPSLCFGVPTGSIDLSISGGIPGYTVAWAGPNGFTSSDLILNNLEGGVYYVTITDSNGCIFVDAVTVTQPEDLIITVDSLTDYNGFNTSCWNSHDGGIYITPSGGTLPYSYQWNTAGNPNFSNQQDIINQSGGTYEAVLFDANGCVQNEFINLTAPDTLGIDFNPSLFSNGFNISCHGEADGSIEAIPLGGTPNYTYVWIGTNGYGPVFSNPIENLIAGEYSVLMSDANGCSFSNSITLTEPGPFSISLSATGTNGSNIGCNGGADGTINLNITGGSQPFLIDWTGPGGFTSNSEDLFNLSAGQYCVSVTDANGCVHTDCITLTEPDPIVISLIAGVYPNGFNLNCSNSSDGSITTSIAGGTSGYTVFWTGPNNFTSSNPNISGLEAGDYCLVVTDLNGCTKNACIELLAPDPITIELDSLTSPGCSGAVTAAIAISIAGGEPTFTYNWTGPNGFSASTQDISNLETGEYCVYVTDVNLCTSERCFTIDAPDPLTASLATSSFEGGFEIDCNGNTNGSITASANGGTAPYSYNWTGPAGFSETGSQIENLAAGTYCVEITDANDCTISECTTLVAPPILTSAPITTIPNCADGTLAIIDLNISGGVAPYTFNWNTNDDTEIIQVDEGAYTVIVTDANGCSVTQNFTITFPSSITIIHTGVEYAGGYNLVCHGDNSGAISIEIFGGVGNLTANWTGPNGFTSTANDITNLIAGEYCITITDDLGCTGDTCITLIEPDVLSLSSESLMATCNGASDGAITAEVSGGVGTYSVAWTGPNGYTGFGTEINGLQAGTYCATVTDFNGCTLVECVDILQPDPISISLTSPESGGYNIACYGENTGQISSLISGGTPPYSYAWSSPNGYASIDQNPVNLYAGEYCVTITDSLGCNATTCITLTEPDGIGIVFTKFEYPNGYNVSCGGACDGSLTTTLSGGVNPISISWIGPDGFTSNQADLTGLCPGTYILTLTDGNGCEQDASIAILQPDPIGIDLTSPVFAGGYEVACFGDNSGAILADITGGIDPLTISWTGPDGFTANDSTNLENLFAGTYTLTVTDGFNCSASQSIELIQPDSALLASAVAFEYPSGHNISCFGYANGSITAMVTGGTSPYSFNWNGPEGYVSTDQNIANLSAGEYTLVVEDANSCVYTVNVTLTEPIDSLASVLVVDQDIFCFGDSTGALTVNVSGGSSGYSISWSGPDNFVSNAFILTNLPTGTYSYTVTDINGCSSMGAHSFSTPPAIEITADIIDANCETNTGIINISIANAVAPITYIWSDGSTGQDLLNVVPGDYTVEVSDINGCSATKTFVVNSINTLDIEASITNVSCFGDQDGILEISIIQGAQPVTYSWIGPNGFSENGNPIANLEPGSYTVTATDFSGCTVVETYEVSEPEELKISPLSGLEYENGSNLSDFHSGDGVIYAPEVTGGTPPFSYVWTSDNGYSSTSSSNQLNLQAGLFLLEVTDANMCTDTASIVLTEPDRLGIPNGISPNGDGFNDSFYVRGLENYPQNKLIVFNRWGSSVYEQANYRNSDPWYGTNADGEDLAEGTYFVIVELSEGDNLKGYLEIRR